MTTFYLKYRAKSLDELDIESVRTSLQKIVNSKNIPHAFLFTGPKGTGKTSAARILAKIINCESKSPPCGKCDQCKSITNGNNLDVIELDAASNRGIDDVRALRDAVKLSPSHAKKKVYIIDEAHMLTTEASNALLKTLEEPPSHVVFILATTNPEKLIETVKSRTTIINFQKGNDLEVLRSLTRVIKGEKIKISEENINKIIEEAKGSFRDATKLLEQYSLEGEKFLEKNKGVNIEEFVSLLYQKKLKTLLKNISDFSENGISASNLTQEVIRLIRTDLLNDTKNKDLIFLLELLMIALREIPDSPIEELPLEIAIIKYCGDEDEIIEAVNPTLVNGEGVNDDVWRTILASIRPINASIEALLRAAKPVNYDGKILTLGVYYKFHKEKLEDTSNRMVLEDVVCKILGSPTKITCILTEPPIKKVVLTESVDQDIIKVAEEIFSN